MDNRSIAAFIETNKSKQIMNEFCYNVCPVKVRAKKNAKSNDTEGALLPHPRQEQEQRKAS